MADTAQRIAAKRLVKEIIDDLSGRSGLGNMWEECDRDVRREIRAKWEGIAAEWLRWSENNT